MSAMFGFWHFGGQKMTPERVEEIGEVLSPSASDRGSDFAAGGLSIVYRALDITTESENEKQPVISGSGTVVVFDGRLDNRQELLDPGIEGCDARLVAQAYDRFGIDSLTRLIGDWAVSIWDPRSRSLLLACDPVGTRPLYYALGPSQVRWSNVLTALMLADASSLHLDRRYIAGWLSSFPACHLTPYREIAAVSPGTMVRIYQGASFVTEYFRFDHTKRIRYRADAEYEEHFRDLFRQAVERRLRSSRPVLAELSGGIDSSAIVCMADLCLKERLPSSPPRVDTVSYYDDTEPNWDERRYFAEIEHLRQQTGLHIDCSQTRSTILDFEEVRLAALPSAAARATARLPRQLSEAMAEAGYRVLLSGLGGDEVLGGVPTAIPELQDLIAAFRFAALIRRSQSWAISQRRPWLAVLSEAAKGFVPFAIQRSASAHHLPQWVHPRFAAETREFDPPRRIRFTGQLPSFQHNLETLDLLRRQLAAQPMPCDPAYERRYPYLDRDLVQFVYAIPREQVLRPGQRRSLMRRALSGIVPDLVLNRRRKASAVRGPIAAVTLALNRLLTSRQQLLIVELEIVSRAKLESALESLRTGQEMTIVPVIRAISLEGWLRNLAVHGFCGLTAETRPDAFMPGRRGPRLQSARLLS